MRKWFWTLCLCLLVSVPLRVFAQGSCTFSNGAGSCSIACSVGTPVCGEGEAGYPWCFCKGVGFIEMAEIITLDKRLSNNKLVSLQQKLQPQNLPLLALEEEFETHWNIMLFNNIEVREKIKGNLRNAVLSVQNSDFPRFYQYMSEARRLITILPKSESSLIFKKLSKNIEQLSVQSLKSTNIRLEQTNISQPLLSDNLQQNFTFHSIKIDHYPNPFSGNLTLSCSLPGYQRLKITVFNSMGSLIKTICNDEKATGEHHFEWDALDENGQSLPDGTYFCRIETPLGSITRQLVHLK